jgi:hypothetical protein
MGGCDSVTGGFVYRGCRMPGHHGKYFFADYCGGVIESFMVSGGTETNYETWPALSGIGFISSFGQDDEGELYIVVHAAPGGGQGRLYKVVPQ